MLAERQGCLSRPLVARWSAGPRRSPHTFAGAGQSSLGPPSTWGRRQRSRQAGTAVHVHRMGLGEVRWGYRLPACPSSRRCLASSPGPSTCPVGRGASVTVGGVSRGRGSGPGWCRRASQLSSSQKPRPPGLGVVAVVSTPAQARSRRSQRRLSELDTGVAGSGR